MHPRGRLWRSSGSWPSPGHWDHLGNEASQWKTTFSQSLSLSLSYFGHHLLPPGTCIKRNLDCKQTRESNPNTLMWNEDVPNSVTARGPHAHPEKRRFCVTHRTHSSLQRDWEVCLFQFKTNFRTCVILKHCRLKASVTDSKVKCKKPKNNSLEGSE